MTSSAILAASGAARRHSPFQLWLALSLLCALALLSGCSGDDDDVAAPAGLSYAMTSAVYEAGEPIVPNRPSASGGAVARYTVAPALPDGLVLDGTTGVITGTPRAVSPATVYVVTATNARGSATARVQIEVRDTPAAPAGLAYREAAVTYTVGQTIAANTATSSGGPISAYRIAPALPAGLAFDTQTGAITGTPSAVSALTPYTVTGSNVAGETTATVEIAVQAAPVAPASLGYSAPIALYVSGEAIAPNTPIVSGGTTATFAVSPALPPGLSLNTETGVIAGTPTTVQSEAVYTLTASNPAGAAQAQLRISVTSRGSWSPVPPLLVPVHYSTATRLPDGRVLVAGGLSGGSSITAASIYDPAPNTWTATGAMATARSEGTATLLQDGRVLFVGGSLGGTSGLASAEIYHPATGTWQSAGTMSEARINHTATLLPDGRVLVIGGYHDTGTLEFSQTAEVYDPAGGTWTVLATGLASPRAQHAATLLPGGNAVLVASGVNSSGFVTSAELFPVNDSGSTTPLASPALSNNVAQSVLLRNGKALVIGDGGSTAWRFDPVASTWTASAMNVRRAQPIIVPLDDGRVLVAGGTGAGGVRLTSAELYHPDTNSWTAAAGMSVARNAGVGALLPDGRALVIGGFSGSGSVADVERFQP